MSKAPEPTIALLCNKQGVILNVLKNDVGLDAAPGRLFVRLVDEASRSKALDFLLGIQTQGALRSWEINVPLAGRLTTLYFSGGQVGDQILIVGASNGQVAMRLYEEMMSICNEQANMLRAAAKASAATPPVGSDTYLYDEISRLNNELVAMQRELVKKNAELARLNQEKNRFLGMAAHDLRNPLHAVMTASEFLSEHASPVLGESERKLLDIIRSSSQFMAELVDDLLDVAKIEAGQLQLDLAAVDVVEVVQRNVAIHQILAAKKSIAIELHSEPLPTAIIDTAKFEQALNNLIGNAVKFSPPGSTVEVSLVACGDRFRLSVHDQGPGIPPEEQPLLFQPFRRGRSEGTAGEKSTGLGLTIAKRAVEGHGGQIWLESSPGQGTTFFISLPFKPWNKEDL